MVLATMLGEGCPARKIANPKTLMISILVIRRGCEVPDVPSGATVAHPMMSFHAAVSANRSAALADLNDVFAVAEDGVVGSERRNVALFG